LAGLAIALLSLLSPRAPAQSSAAPGISLVWSKNVGGLRSFSLSPHARRLALLTTEGKLALWTAQDGQPVWAVERQNANAILVSDGTGFVLTYNQRSLTAEQATLRRADSGATIWTQNFDSPVWSGAFNQDGRFAVVGTGSDNIYVYNLAVDREVTKSSVPGTPFSIAFAADSGSILVGEWDRSGIACLDLAGKMMWQAGGDSNRKYMVAHVGPRYITVVGSSNRHGKSPIIYVVRSSSGEVLWVYNLDTDCYNTNVQTSDTAEISGLSYTRSQATSDSQRSVQKLGEIDRQGQMKWTKGGLFWAPTLICLTPDQEGFVVYDGKRKLYQLDSQGRTVATALLSDTLREWAASSDNASLIVYTHDGQLSLLHIQ
jgi:hypothetical protein